jgi:glucose-1-phosphate adenylyltransferase
VGSRLYPLTQFRSKPAVPIAGKFRLIDIPISNCLNAGVNRIFVLTQFNSASLNSHVKNAYHFDIFSNGFVDILAAEQTRANSAWFQGTADAVRQTRSYLENEKYDYLMILSGDQLYQMDYTKILEYHRDQNADITVATIPVNDRDAPGFGILKVDADGIIEDFVEKPAKEELGQWTSPVEDQYAAEGKNYLASMGIYIFSNGVLGKLFDELPDAIDFGKEIIPTAVQSKEYKVTSYPFGGYWTDIGTIASFFEANLRLTQYLPEFNLYDNINKVYTNARMLSPSKVFGTHVSHTLIAEGCIIHANSIDNTIVGVRSRIGKFTNIKSSIIMGIDFYQSMKDMETNPKLILLGIGENCHIENTIIDKNVKIGDNCTIKGGNHLEDSETDTHCVRDGIVIVRKGAVIPDNTHIGV